MDDGWGHAIYDNFDSACSSWSMMMMVLVVLTVMLMVMLEYGWCSDGDVGAYPQMILCFSVWACIQLGQWYVTNSTEKLYCFAICGIKSCGNHHQSSHFSQMFFRIPNAIRIENTNLICSR